MSNTKDILDNALINLVLDFPRYAELITRIGVKIVKSPLEYTAWTDGKGIYVNETAVDNFNANPIREGTSGEKYNCAITKKEMQFILCHELLHLIGLTYDRGKTIGIYARQGMSAKERRRFQLWNSATDYEINSLLHNNETTDATYGDKKRNPVGNMPDWVLYKSEYKHMNAEEIFAILEKEDEEQRKQSGMSAEEWAKQFDDIGDGNGKDGLPGLDEHLPIEDEDTKNEIIAKVSEVYGSRSNGLGESGLDRLVSRVYVPQPFNWRRALAKYIHGYVKANYTWNKPSRAGIANNIILPSAGQAPKLRIGVAIDTSGSISNLEIDTMMNHLYTILQQFKAFEIDIWSCGSVVYKESLLKITEQNKAKLKEFRTISDGGNDMRENFKFIKDYYKGKDKIDLLIIMSDFYDPLDGDTTTTSICPCLFMCIDHKDFKKPTKIKGEVYPFEVDKNK